jgi:hypothetical protein
VQDTDDNRDITTNNAQLPVVAWFPRSVDWSTSTPLPGRLDGWIVQFGHASLPPGPQLANPPGAG